MKVNWKVRFKNPVFIAQLVMSILLPILAYFGMTVENVTSWSILGQTLLDAISNPYVVGTVIVSLWCCITDPTTKGVNDSQRALTYDEPV